MKIDIDSVKAVILQNNSLNGLKSDMQHLGFDFQEGRKGEKKAYNESLEYWKKIRESEFPFYEIPQRKPQTLSFTEIRKRDDTFKIYGIIDSFQSSHDGA